MAHIRERELLFGPQSLLSNYGPLVAEICSRSDIYKDKSLQAAATLCLAKLMCVSSEYCEAHLPLLITIMERSPNPTVRSNVVIALGDMAVCFNHLIDENTDFLYRRLADSDLSVKRTCLMTLTFLILAGQVKVKGQLGEMAKCLEDEDKRIADLARMFFTELSTKDNAVYNHFVDMFSLLSAGQMNEEPFRRIIKFLLGFVEKDKHARQLADKLAARLPRCETERQWSDVAFALGLLQHKNEDINKTDTCRYGPTMADRSERDEDSRYSTDSGTHLLTSPLPFSSTSQDADMEHDPVNGGEEEEEGGAVNHARMVRRIDAHVLPLLFLTYVFNFMDKTILSSASVFGLREDNHLVGNQYAWVSSVFYFGYLVATYPATRLVTRLPVGKYLGANTLFWGTVVALTAASRGFGALLALRFLLGVAEASVSPALVFVTSTWYTRDEIPSRTGVWFAGNSVGGIVSSLLAYGLGHVHQHLAPWRWMFIVLGAATFLLGVFLLAFLPDSIATARFLDPTERKAATDRVVVAGLGATDKTAWKWCQMRECLLDPKTWMIASLALLCQIPNGGTQNFANIVITSFGFDALQSTLINIPYSVLSIVAIAGSGWVAGRFRSMNCILIALVVLPPIIGSALISHRATLPHRVSLLGYFLLATGPAVLPLLLSLVQSNFRGVTKKMTMTALLFVAYCAGNIAGPQLFIAAEAPTYDTAFRAILICYSLVVGLSLALRIYLESVNRRRQRSEGVRGSAGTAGAVAGGKIVDVHGAVREVRLTPEDYEDVTDWNTFGFRYRI
ncbi:hypothetical protein E0Z10_g4299 [Xylaria hypoxylon]|uniref:Major facilitator superfamily (MFS) profile domain-containing protein n=1 Tax=Xylaria hypoxylon TaxID=37992 RepID=A0A4Z0YZ43_9PEZI|nr:hypothetical protein E0Z10_g4299 [Xylaria hypoxylon]